LIVTFLIHETKILAEFGIDRRTVLGAAAFSILFVISFNLFALLTFLLFCLKLLLFLAKGE